MYKELTEEEKKELERFPKYDSSKTETWVGSKDYWEAIFETETNRDPELHEAFSKLHEDIVNMVIRFCKEHDLNDVDEFHVGADGIRGSIKYGEWCPCTDSYMSMYNLKHDEKMDWDYVDREEPFLHEI